MQLNRRTWDRESIKCYLINSVIDHDEYCMLTACWWHVEGQAVAAWDTRSVVLVNTQFLARWECYKKAFWPNVQQLKPDLMVAMPKPNSTSFPTYFQLSCLSQSFLEHDESTKDWIAKIPSDQMRGSESEFRYSRIPRCSTLITTNFNYKAYLSAIRLILMAPKNFVTHVLQKSYSNTSWWDHECVGIGSRLGHASASGQNRLVVAS